MGIRDSLKMIRGAPPKVSAERAAELERAGKLADRHGAAVLLSVSERILPETYRGFAVRVTVGAYPPDAPSSHRRAVYAQLHPVDAKARALCEAKGRDFVLGMIPLTAEGAALVIENPIGPEAEQAAKDALAVAMRFVNRWLPKESTA